MSAERVTVFGGSGFIGRHIVSRLAALGYEVRVATRSPGPMPDLEPGDAKRPAGTEKTGKGGSVLPVYASVTDPASVRAALRDCDMAVNLVSILTEPEEGAFEAVNARAPGDVARIARESGVRKLVHVSAIGASADAPSGYGRSKAQGEQNVRAHFPDARILRPSVVFGPGDSFLTMFGLMAKVLPVLPVYSADTRLQPVYVEDVAGAAIACLLQEDLPEETVFELGGPDRLTMEEIMAFTARGVGRTPRLIRVPDRLAQLQAGLFERLPGKLLTRDQLAMLSRDNVVSPDAAGLDTLGIRAQSLQDRAPDYLSKLSLLRAFRK
ncbi:complex I NDUFA9 subunit family protein [Swaminathania salitolerans]|uniref:3-beta-hydroxy-Delta(5)-steroid dehydrogenase n=1 Tax=Swaminathania salitolerans TaxID=182838 RepID=A0A511BU18_9PROT|nr:complex I NDUFA9 subunit family protein [Swaminathania salitolerans]GBQ15713.1 NADH-ubiquinone oxidoreductase 39 kDa subunit [Swaminathania salitolerans LMG 21291]GEL01458.1 3-beta-hydroxy-Delta(5)-steroid dehydrogenase [Swaminathania salitolerans]